MRRTLLSIIATLGLALPVYGDVTVSGGGSAGGPPPQTTVGALGACDNTTQGARRTVTDAANATTCSAGGGSTRNVCRCDDNVWVLEGVGTVDPGDKGDVTVGGTWEIDADAVGAAEIAASAVGASEVSDGSLMAADLGADSVSASELDALGVEAELEAALDLTDINGQVAAADVADNAVTEPKLDVLDSPADGERIAYNSGSGRLEWVPPGSTLLDTVGAALIYDSGRDCWVTDLDDDGSVALSEGEPCADDTNVFRVSDFASFSAAVTAVNNALGGVLVVDQNVTITIMTGQLPAIQLNQQTQLVGLGRALPSLATATITCNFPTAGSTESCIGINGSNVIIDSVRILADSDISNETTLDWTDRDVLVEVMPTSHTNVRILNSYLRSDPTTDKGTGIYVAGCAKCDVEGNHLEGLNTGLYVTNTSSVSTSDLRVIGNRISDGLYGVIVDGNGTARTGGSFSVLNATDAMTFEANHVDGNFNAAWITGDADNNSASGNRLFHFQAIDSRLASTPAAVVCTDNGVAQTASQNSCCLKANQVTGIDLEDNPDVASTGASSKFVNGDVVRFSSISTTTQLSERTTETTQVGLNSFKIQANAEAWTAWGSPASTVYAMVSPCNTNVYAQHQGSVITNGVTFRGNLTNSVDVVRPLGAGQVETPDLSRGDVYENSPLNRYDHSAETRVVVAGASKRLNDNASIHYSLRQFQSGASPYDSVVSVPVGNYPRARHLEVIKRNLESLGVVHRRFSPREDGPQAFRVRRLTLYDDALADCGPKTDGELFRIKNTEANTGGDLQQLSTLGYVTGDHVLTGSFNGTDRVSGDSQCIEGSEGTENAGWCECEWTAAGYNAPGAAFFAGDVTGVGTSSGDTEANIAGTRTFVDGDVNTGTDAITETSHTLLTGYGPYRLTTSGTVPAGLATGTDYWIIKVDANSFKFASSYANAIAGIAVDITAAAGGGTHTLAGAFTADDLIGAWAVLREGTVTEEWRKVVDNDADTIEWAISLATNAAASHTVKVFKGTPRLLGRQMALGRDGDWWQYRSTGDTFNITSGGVTSASTATVNATAHPFQVGDWVEFQDVTSMPEMNGVRGEVATRATNTFTVRVDTRNHAAGGGSGGTVRGVARYNPTWSVDTVPFVPHLSGTHADQQNPMITIQNNIPGMCQQVELVNSTRRGTLNGINTQTTASFLEVMVKQATSLVDPSAQGINAPYGFAGFVSNIAAGGSPSIVIKSNGSDRNDEVNDFSTGYGVLYYNSALHWVSQRGGTEAIPLPHEALNFDTDAKQDGFYQKHCSQFRTMWIYHWGGQGANNWPKTVLWNKGCYAAMGGMDNDPLNASWQAAYENDTNPLTLNPPDTVAMGTVAAMCNKSTNPLGTEAEFNVWRWEQRHYPMSD